MSTAAGPLLILGAIVVTCSGALIVAVRISYSKAFARKPKSFLHNDPEFAAGADTGDPPPDGWASEKDWFAASCAKRLTIVSEDGITLSAWSLETQDDGANTVILVHGYSGKSDDMAPLARFYIEQFGFDVLMPDLRGHGESEGDYIGFGWPDRRDLVKWAEMIVARKGPDTRIMLHGLSMGAAAVMMAAGESDLPAAVKCAVEDCGYTSVVDILRHQLKRMYHIPAFPVLPATLRLAKRRTGQSFENASAVAQVRKARIPLLFVHGKSDDFVPFAMERILYEACVSEKSILEVEGARHAGSYWTAQGAYRNAIEKAVTAYFAGD